MPIRVRLAIAVLCLSFGALPARAMQFSQESASQTELFLVGRGPIVSGDAERLNKALTLVPAGTRILALALDSPGGLVTEGELLSSLIKNRSLPVAIAADRQCVSACFLLFAAAPRKYVASNALVGVHSASENGQENETTMAVSVQMARIATGLGVPPAIVGKMVATKPGSVAWLTPADFTAMGAKTYNDDIVGATRDTGPLPVLPPIASPGATPSVPLPTLPRPSNGTQTAGPQPHYVPSDHFVAPQASTAQRPSPVSGNASAPGFLAGRQDRGEWDRWLAAQAPAFREGAVLAQLQSSVAGAGPAVCRGPNGADQGEITVGCEAGLRRLATAQAKRRMDPNYASGWDSAGLPVIPSHAIVAEYQGAFFCGRQIGRLTVRVLVHADEPVQRAVFLFGPQPTSPDVPSGAFMAQGSFDAANAGLRMSPASWLSQPVNYPWFGLNGTSTDAGSTITGQVTDNTGCSQFTLKRVNISR